MNNKKEQFYLGYRIAKNDVFNSDECMNHYIDMTKWCNDRGYIINSIHEESTNTDFYEITEYHEPEKTEEEILRKELSELHNWFDEHRYIAEKIAYGRATREEYSDIISQMDGKAQRINEIRSLLGIVSETNGTL